LKQSKSKKVRPSELQLGMRRTSSREPIKMHQLSSPAEILKSYPDILRNLSGQRMLPSEVADVGRRRRGAAREQIILIREEIGER
jgi:hypothetical protein